MDERLKNAIKVANYMTTFNTQREILKQEYVDSCTYHEDGHRFTINRELINFLTTLISMNRSVDVVILDDFENPFMIADVLQFRDKIFDLYVESTNKYYHDFLKLKSSRSLEKILDV